MFTVANRGEMNEKVSHRPAVAGLALVCAGVALAATHTVKVTPKNFTAIFNRGDNRPVSSYAFVAGRRSRRSARAASS